MVAATTVARRLAERPAYASPLGHVTFAGTANNFLSVPYSPDWNITEEGITATFRMRVPAWGSGSTGVLLAQFADSGAPRWDIRLTADGALQIITHDGVNPATTTTAVSSTVLQELPVDEWVDLAVVYIPDVDGNRHAHGFASPDGGASWNWLGSSTGGAADTVAPSTAPLTIAATATGSSPFSGDLQHVALYRGHGVDVIEQVDDDPIETIVPGGVELFKMTGAEPGRADVDEFLSASGHAVTVHRSGASPTTITPAVHRGVPLGVGDWRLVIERLRGAGAVVGVDKVDTGVVGSLVWEDLTPAWRGYSSTRGAQVPRGRPMVGEVFLTVDARSDPSLDPYFDYTNTRAGTIIRCGLVSLADHRADGWLPQWCGLVDSWSPTYVQGADRFADVTLVETLSVLAQIDDNALPSPVGAGERLVARADRLLSAAEWRFGLVSLFGPLFGEPSITLQSTDMAMNRSVELYLTADSTGGVIRSDVTGAALVTDRAADRPTRLADFSTFFGNATLAVTTADDDLDGDTVAIAYDRDSVITSTSPDALVNEHRYARAGGTEQVAVHKVSQGVFRSKRVRARGDLLCQLDAHALFVAWADNDREARTTLSIDAVTVTCTGKPGRYLPVAATDIGDLLLVFPQSADPEFAGTVLGEVRARTDEVRPLFGRVGWTTTFAADPVSIVGVPGALLDPAPR